ncbi:MAG TPA: tetratricopeptide repeat protein [Phnomibacter sp.]|nr:tetratricopeptide repeat protein [Phnomibacter sp.]
MEKLKAYLEAQPEDAFLQHALALEYIKLGNDAEARLLFENIISTQPGYVGTYYHLAKLYERAQLVEQAIQTYEAGMAQARRVADNHAYHELQAALEDLTDSEL